MIHYILVTKYDGDKPGLKKTWFLKCLHLLHDLNMVLVLIPAGHKCIPFASCEVFKDKKSQTFWIPTLIESTCVKKKLKKGKQALHAGDF